MVLFSKAIIILLLASILFALGSALYYLVHDKADSTRMAKALTWRFGLSILLFILVLIAFGFGWLTPHQI